MLTSFYDVAVLGRRPGCLMAAALLAKQGFRVVLVGQGQPNRMFESGPRTLPRQPSPVFSASAPVLLRTVRELSLATVDDCQEPVSPEPLLQVALPGQRLDFWSDAAALRQEFAREFPTLGRIVEEMHASLEHPMNQLDGLTGMDLIWPPDGFFEKRRFATATRSLQTDLAPVLSHLSSFPPSHPFAITMRLVTQFMGHSDPKTASALGTVRLWHQAIHASATPGAEAFYSNLHKKLVNLGVELRLDDSVQRIHIRRGRVEGLEMEYSSEAIGVGFLLSGVDVRTLAQLLPDRRNFDDLFERLGEPQVRYLRFTLVAAVDRTALPSGLARRFFSVENLSGALHSENALHVEVRHDGDESLLVVEALLPRGWVEEVEDYLPQVRQKVLAHLQRVLHLPRECIRWVDSPHDHHPPHDGQGEVMAALKEPWRRGPAQMEPIHHFPVTGPLDVCALPCRTPIQRILLCNTQAVPGLGLEGELLSGLSATRIIERSDRNKERMRRGLWTKIDL